MAIWGKLFGAVTGFAMGGPVGAAMGAALGHAADHGSLLEAPIGGWGERWSTKGRPDPNGAAFMAAVKMSALLGKTDQVYAIGLVSLCAKLAKIDAPVNRAEIRAFKAIFRFPPDNTREVGLLFDRARERTDDYELYSLELGKAFAKNQAPLEDLLNALFVIARADAEDPNHLHPKELAFLRRVHRCFGLSPGAWDRAMGNIARASDGIERAYRTLGLSQKASDSEVKVRWRALIREHHPDVLLRKELSPEKMAQAAEKVAKINAAWDRIKRDRKL